MGPNWCNLPEEILSLIIKRIDIASDYFSFRGVCKSWRSMAIIDSNVWFPQPPWLILPLPEYPYDKEKLNIPTRRNLASLSEPNTTYQLDLPEPRYNMCVGSIGMWLVTLDPESNEVRLLNLFSRVQIDLPSATTITSDEDDDGGCFVTLTKVIISSTPSQQNPRDCIAMGIFESENYGNGLTFARPDDRSWTVLESESLCERQFGSFADVIFFNDAFYGVSCLGYLVVCDINGPHPPTVSLVMPISEAFFSFDTNCYLVELLGELLLVFKVGDYSTEEEEDNSTSRPTSFTVYKLNLTTKKMEELKSLGQFSLFLGCNVSVPLLASDSSTWKRNCIYFTDHNYYPQRNKMGYGVFDLEKGSVQPYYSTNLSSPHSPNLWVIPNVW